MPSPLDLAELPVPARGARGGRPARRGRRSAERVDRAATARLLHPRRRLGHLPGPGHRRRDRGQPPARGAGRGARVRRRRGARRRAGREPSEATALLLVAALAGGVVLASDVFESGAAVDRLLFGTLLGLGRPISASAAPVAVALRHRWRSGARGRRSAFDPDGAPALGLPAARADLASCWRWWRSPRWRRSPPSARCWWARSSCCRPPRRAWSPAAIPGSWAGRWRSRSRRGWSGSTALLAGPAARAAGGRARRAHLRRARHRPVCAAGRPGRPSVSGPALSPRTCPPATAAGPPSAR